MVCCIHMVHVLELHLPGASAEYLQSPPQAYSVQLFYDVSELEASSLVRSINRPGGQPNWPCQSHH